MKFGDDAQPLSDAFPANYAAQAYAHGFRYRSVLTCEKACAGKIKTTLLCATFTKSFSGRRAGSTRGKIFQQAVL